MKRRFLLGNDRYIDVIDDARIDFYDPKSIERTKTFGSAQTAFLLALLKKPGELVPYRDLYLAYTPVYSDVFIGKESRLVQEIKSRLPSAIKAAIFAVRGEGLCFRAELDPIIEAESKKETQRRLSNIEFSQLESKVNVYFTKRAILDKELSIRGRFGLDMDAWLNEPSEKRRLEKFTGKNYVDRIVFVGMAATSLFMNKTHFDSAQQTEPIANKLKDLFETLLYQEDFRATVVINRPGSNAVSDARLYYKVANDSFRNDVSAMFTASAQEVKKLLQTEGSAYQKAHSENRFQVLLTDMCLPYSLFLVEYKADAKKLGFRSHVKIDLYSPGLLITNDRPSMIVFEDDELFSFFKQQAEEIATRFSVDINSKSIKDQETKQWSKDWECFQESRATKFNRVK